MPTRKMLESVAAEYAAMSTPELVAAAEAMGLEDNIAGLDRSAIIDVLMAVEEEAAFH